MDAELIVEQMRTHIRAQRAQSQAALLRRLETLQEYHYHVGIQKAYADMDTALTDLIRKSNAPATGDEKP